MKNKFGFNLNNPAAYPRWAGEYADLIPRPPKKKRGPNRLKPRKKRK